MFHKINSIMATENYKLIAHFWSGETKIYDLEPIFKKWPIFNELKKPESDYYDVKVDEGGYGISWNDHLDLSCDEIWEKGREIYTNFDHILSFGDAAKIWQLDESTLRKVVANGKFIIGIEACKYGKQWLITSDAMLKKYGEPKLKISN